MLFYESPLRSFSYVKKYFLTNKRKSFAKKCVTFANKRKSFANYSVTFANYRVTFANFRVTFANNAKHSQIKEKLSRINAEPIYKYCHFMQKPL